MICILSPNITMEDIQYPEMREVLNNITYHQWPPKPLPNVTVSKIRFRHFWDKLYMDIVKRDNKRYPNIEIISPNRNVPI